LEDVVGGTVATDTGECEQGKKRVKDKKRENRLIREK